MHLGEETLMLDCNLYTSTYVRIILYALALVDLCWTYIRTPWWNQASTFWQMLSLVFCAPNLKPSSHVTSVVRIALCGFIAIVVLTAAWFSLFCHLQWYCHPSLTFTEQISIMCPSQCWVPFSVLWNTIHRKALRGGYWYYPLPSHFCFLQMRKWMCRECKNLVFKVKQLVSIIACILLQAVLF